MAKGKCAGQNQKECADTNARMVETATKQLIANVTKIMKYSFREEVTVEEDGLHSKKGKKAEMEMPRTVTSVWTITSVRKNIL